MYVNTVHVFSSFDEHCKEIQAYISCKQGAELSMCENDHEKTECTKILNTRVRLNIIIFFLLHLPHDNIELIHVPEFSTL